MRLIASLVLVALSACAAAEVQPPRAIDAAPVPGVWSLAEHVEDLRAASCPDGAADLPAEAIELRVIEAERGDEEARARQLTGLTLAGAWQLESKQPDFGGLSGLAVLPSGSLLAISDAGAFISISIDAETGAPDGGGTISFMRDLSGNPFANKRDGDSEGLSVRDGLAFVSFEQDHRIAAFDLGRCGAAARAAPVAALSPVVNGKLLQDNRGPEALTLAGEALELGFERRDGGGSPVGRLNTDATLSDITVTEQPLFFLITGMDTRGDLSARIFRAYDPVRGARVRLQVDQAGTRIGDGLFSPPLPVDNFEGVAIGQAPSGSARIWLVSDDNFSGNQRTLLLALDLDP